jgi:hypothetical protein
LPGLVRLHAPEVEPELEGADTVEADLAERRKMMEGLGE